MPAERCEQGLRAAAHLEAERVRAGALHLHAAQAVDRRRLAGEHNVDRLCGQVAQLGERSLVDEAAGAKNADAVAHRLDLAQHVRGEKDRLPPLLRLARCLPEGNLHQRVEAARRLVEDQQVGAGGEGRHQLYLLPVPLRKRAHLLARVELEPFDEQVAVGTVGGAVQAREVGEGLVTGQRRPEKRLPRDIDDAPMGSDRVAPGVDAKQRGAASARPMQPEQQPDRCRLTCPIWDEVAVHLSWRDREIETIERERRAVALRQPLGEDRRRRAHFGHEIILAGSLPARPRRGAQQSSGPAHSMLFGASRRPS